MAAHTAVQVRNHVPSIEPPHESGVDEMIAMKVLELVLITIFIAAWLHVAIVTLAAIVYAMNGQESIDRRLKEVGYLRNEESSHQFQEFTMRKSMKYHHISSGRKK